MFRRIFFVLFLYATATGAYAATPPIAHAQDLTPSERAELERQYAELQREIEVQQQIIKETQAKKNTLQGDVTLLDAKIKEAQAQINAKNIAIKQLTAQIQRKNVIIDDLAKRIERGRESLASLLRQTQILDDSSVAAVVLGSKSVSEFFNDLDAFVSLKTALKDRFADIRAAKTQTEEEKADLAEKQSQTIDAKYVVEVKQKQISTDKVEKQKLLVLTASQEVEYKKILAERQAKAAAIRAALFPLRDAGPITFGSALAYAKEAQSRTGVRPAFILAVLTQESNLGANVGQCYLSNNSTGAGVGKNTGTPFAKVMAPTRDVPPFLSLASELGFDPHRQVVSCPIQSAGGWGGAMGPAQFIPSTWKLYASRVAAAVGVSTANPWDPKDAIAAMSFLLADNGAKAGGYTAESNAAARYYAGWNGATTRAGRTYANQVMALAESIQSNIDFLSNS